MQCVDESLELLVGEIVDVAHAAVVVTLVEQMLIELITGEPSRLDSMTSTRTGLQHLRKENWIRRVPAIVEVLKESTELDECVIVQHLTDRMTEMKSRTTK